MAEQNHYDELRCDIEQDLSEYTDADRYAVYGYVYAHYILGHLTLGQLNEFRELIGLSIEDVDDLRV